jgi:catechol 2,3-dioxygenase-like lactoylglutathione lyase family enzyme
MSVPFKTPRVEAGTIAPMFLGLRTIIYPSPDLDAAKAWFTGLLGFEPYFDEPFYVGYSVGGYELALDPNGSVDDGPVTYWGVPDCDEARARLLDAGATPRHPVRDVGDSIRVATVVEPSGSIIGIIENPHFQLPDGPASPGPGR